MSRIHDELLEEHDLVSEGLDGLPLSGLQLGLELGLRQTDAHPLPTSAPHRLNSQIKNNVNYNLTVNINYLCTYDLYGPVRKVLDLGR